MRGTPAWITACAALAISATRVHADFITIDYALVSFEWGLYADGGVMVTSDIGYVYSWNLGEPVFFAAGLDDVYAGANIELSGTTTLSHTDRRVAIALDAELTARAWTLDNPYWDYERAIGTWTNATVDVLVTFDEITTASIDGVQQTYQPGSYDFSWISHSPLAYAEARGPGMADCDTGELHFLADFLVVPAPSAILPLALLGALRPRRT
jgi:hypothetical protein